jgi:LacI family transcriptional regulator
MNTTGKGRLKLEDVARMSGVSRSTVSRVINQHPNVSEPVRQRVWGVIQETGYHPHQAARSLALQRSNILGLVIPRSVQSFFSDPYFPRLTQGVAQACNEHNATLSLFLFHTKEDERNLFPRLSRPGLVDGIIIQATHADDDLFNQLSQSDIPFIVAGRPMNVPDASYVDVDNVRGAFTAVRHLIHQGFRRIGTITGPLNTSTGQDRLSGYRKAQDDSGIDFDERLVVEGDFSQDSGYYAAKRLLQHKPEAIFVASDMMALGALRALRENGMQVPEDIAIVGFDDIPDAAQMSPHLTTIRQPIHSMGMQLVETLLDVIDNGSKPPRRVVFGTELVIRESCGANQSMKRKLVNPDGNGYSQDHERR